MQTGGARSISTSGTRRPAQVRSRSISGSGRPNPCCRRGGANPVRGRRRTPAADDEVVMPLAIVHVHVCAGGGRGRENRHAHDKSGKSTLQTAPRLHRCLSGLQPWCAVAHWHRSGAGSHDPAAAEAGRDRSIRVAGDGRRSSAGRFLHRLRPPVFSVGNHSTAAPVRTSGGSADSRWPGLTYRCAMTCTRALSANPGRKQPVSAILIAAVALAAIVAGAWFGAFLRTVLPEHHLTAETEDVVRIGIGVIATMAATACCRTTIRRPPAPRTSGGFSKSSRGLFRRQRRSARCRDGRCNWPAIWRRPTGCWSSSWAARFRYHFWFCSSCGLRSFSSASPCSRRTTGRSTPCCLRADCR